MCSIQADVDISECQKLTKKKANSVSRPSWLARCSLPVQHSNPMPTKVTVMTQYQLTELASKMLPASAT